MLELKLTQIAKLVSVNGRKEFHGEDTVTAFDLDFECVMTDAVCDNFCMDEEYFSGTLWKNDDDGTVRHPQMGAFSINLKYEDHQVKLFSPILENSEAIEILNNCNIKKIKMLPKDGNIAAVKFQIQGQVGENEKIGRLFNELLGCDVKLVINPQQTDLINSANHAEAELEMKRDDELELDLRAGVK